MCVLINAFFPYIEKHFLIVPSQSLNHVIGAHDMNDDIQISIVNQNLHFLGIENLFQPRLFADHDTGVQVCVDVITFVKLASSNVNPSEID